MTPQDQYTVDIVRNDSRLALWLVYGAVLDPSPDDRAMLGEYLSLRTKLADQATGPLDYQNTDAELRRIIDQL